MSLAALIFDVDGTLADTEEQHRLAFNRAFEERGLAYQWSQHDYRRLLRIPGGKERLAGYFAEQAPDERERARLLAEIPALHAEKSRRYGLAVESGEVPLRPGVERLLDDAAARGLQLAIASTTSLSNIEVLLRAALGPRGLERFAVIACGDMVPAKKPAPDIYLLALARLGLPAARAVAFEDSLPGLQSARAAGLFTVVTPTFWSAGDDLSAADLLIDSLEQSARVLGAAEAAARRSTVPSSSLP